MGSAAIAEILHHYLGAVAKQKLKERMERKIPEIVGKMTVKGIVPGTVPLAVIVHDALFRLIRVVIPSGDVSDFLRDKADAKVQPAVRARTTVASGLAEIVKVTLEELMGHWF